MCPHNPDCLMALADLIAPYRICSFVKVYSQLFQTLLEDTFNFDELSETRPPQPSSGHQSIIKVAEVYIHVKNVMLYIF